VPDRKNAVAPNDCCVDFCNQSFASFILFKRILAPTDGSELSNKAITNGEQFAEEINARISGRTITPPLHYFGLDATQIMDTVKGTEDHAAAQTQRALTSLPDAAKADGVACQILHCSSRHRQEETVKTAAKQDCDVIFQAPYGRRGIKALLLGGNIHQVLTPNQIPALTFR